MNGTLLAGLALTVLSVVGYVAGTVGSYPGRAFTLTGLMVGLTLAAIGGGAEL